MMEGLVKQLTSVHVLIALLLTLTQTPSSKCTMFCVYIVRHGCTFVISLEREAVLADFYSFGVHNR